MRFTGRVLADQAFSQSAVTLLGASTLALMLHARVAPNPNTHPITQRARRLLATFDVYLTTTLWILAVSDGYILFRHLATNTATLTPGNRQWIEWLLLVQVVGLGVISIVNRVIPVAWKASEAPYLEPRLDDVMLGNLYLALMAALSVGFPLLALTGHFGAQVLAFIAVGAIMLAWAELVPALSSPIDRRLARYWDGRARSHGYEEALVHVELPGGFPCLAVTGLHRKDAKGVEFLGYDEARRLVRHHNGARRFTLTKSATARVPEHIRLKLSLRNFGWLVVAGGRAGRLPWTWRRPAHAPRGFVRWDGHGLPALQVAGQPPAVAAEQ